MVTDSATNQWTTITSCHLPSCRGMHDELTSTVLNALNSLPPVNKASLLLDTALTLIEAGK